MFNDLDKYLNSFSNPYNPVYFCLFIIIIFVFFSWFISHKFFIPAQRRHLSEKKKLENDKKLLEFENNRIIAAFSEADPNPVVRTNIDGAIIHSNRSAKLLFNLCDNNINISELIPEFNFNISEEIEKGSNIELSIPRGERYFSVYFYGLQNLQMARIYFVDLTERISNEKKIIEAKEKYRDLSFYFQEQLETEKNRIGLELHDVISQSLLFLKLKLKKITIPEGDSALIETNEHLDTTILQLREIMFNLKPKILDDSGLFPAVQALSDHMSKEFDVLGNVEYLGELRRFEKKTELYLFRIIQEALSNILRHSKASEYSIQLIFAKEYLKIMISDNGVGFYTDGITAMKGYGLMNMRERITNLNGKMQISSCHNEGTLLIFEIPY
jgi:signal transduction histidine kinase